VVPLGITPALKPRRHEGYPFRRRSFFGDILSINPNSYWGALRHQHIIHSFAPSLLGRLSLAMSGLALVLFLVENMGSFAAAGAITAVLGIANVIATPWRARLIDRFGQGRIVLILGLAHGVALLAFAASATFPLPALIVLALLAGGSSPPLGATMRAIWSRALPSGALRTRGFSLDAVSEEVMFTVGPLLAALLTSLWGPTISLMAAAAAVIVGTVAFVASPLSRLQRGHTSALGVRTTAHRTPLRTPGFPVIVVVLVVPGIILGAVEIAAPAIGSSQNNTLLSGALLALFAGGSAVGGLAFGRLELRSSLPRQILVLATGMLLASALVALVGGVVVSLVGFALMGAVLAPLMIAGYLAADTLVDPRARTEASSWINTAVNFGAAIGSGLLGLTADSYSAGGALLVCAIAGGLLLALCIPKLAPRTRN